MTVPLSQTETDRANAALAHIGEPAISSIDDAGRKAARECRKHFARVRDQLLRSAHWQFAKGTAQPGSSGAPPDALYLYRYPMPEDCIAVRGIRGAETYQWEVRHAGQGEDGDIRVMVDTDVAGALIFYTRRVVNPAQWDELFTEVFDLALAAAINPLVGRDKSKTADLLALAEAKLPRARNKDARERGPDYVTRDTSWSRVRRGVS